MDDDSKPPTPQQSGNVMPGLELDRQNRMPNAVARARAQSEELAAAMEEFHRQEQRPLPGGLILNGPVGDNEPQRQQPVAPPQEEMPHKKTLAQEEKEVKERLRQNLHARRQQKMAQAPAERAESEARAARENLRQEEQRQTTIAQMMMVHAAQANLIARPHFPIQLDQQEMMNLQAHQQRQQSMMRAHAVQAEMIARPHVPIQLDQQEMMNLQAHQQQQQQSTMRLQEMHQVAKAQQMQIDEVQRPISPIHPPIYLDEQQMHLQAQQQRQHSMMMAHAAQADLIARPHFPIQLDQQEMMQQQQQQHSMIRLQEMHEVARAQQMQIDEVQRPISPESEARAARESLRQEEPRQTTIAQMMLAHAAQAELIARPNFPIQLDQRELMHLQQHQQQQHSMMKLQEMQEVARAQQMQIDEVQRPISPIHPPIYLDEQQMHLQAQQQRQHSMMMAHAAQADLIARPHFPIQLDQQEMMQQQQQQHSMIRLQEMHEVARAQQMQIDEVQRPISPESEARAARESLRQEEPRQTTIAQMMLAHAAQAELIARPNFPIQLDQRELMHLQQHQQQQHSMMKLQEMQEVARAQQMQIDEVQRPISPIHPPIYMDEQQMYLEEQQHQRDMMRAQQMQSAIMDMERRSDDLEREQSQLMFLVQRQQEHQQNMDAVLQMQSQMIVQQHFPMSSLDTSDVPLSSDYPHDLIRSKDQKKKLQKRRPKVKTEAPSTPPPRPPTPPNLSYLAHLEDLERKRLIKQIQSMDLTKPAPEQKPPELRTVRERVLELNPNLTEEEIAQRVTALEKARIPNPNKVHPHIIDIAQDLRAFIDNIRENRQLQHELQCNLNVKSFYYHDAMNSLARWRADKNDKQLKKEFKKDMKRWRKAAKKNLRRAKANLYCRQERWLTHTDCQLYQRLAIKYGLKVDLEDYNSDED